MNRKDEILTAVALILLAVLLAVMIATVINPEPVVKLIDPIKLKVSSDKLSYEYPDDPRNSAFGCP